MLLFSFAFVPKFDISSISTNFRWRRDLINFYVHFRLSARDRIYNNVIIGKNGWFFLSGDGSITDYQNIDPLNKKKLLNLQKNLDQLSMELKQKGITLLVVIPPNKTTIYSQDMPVQIPVIGSTSRLDQFVQHMKLNGRTSILDLRPVLLDASHSQQVYYRTDTHWNDLGAYYGYAATLNALSSDYPQIKPHGRSDFRYIYAGNSTHELPLLMGLSSYLEADWVMVPDFEVHLDESKIALPDGRYIRTVTNVEKQLPELLVFGDSFYGALAHFVEPHFSRVKTIPFTYEDGIWSLDWIQHENPDVVIIEVVERYIDVTLPKLFEK
jgi:hypothetical protein